MNDSDRPKRLLSIDGGGIRGIIAAEVLKKIEDLLCNSPNSPWKCLGDYFDFIGGTSTGAILAAGIAKGMKVQDLLDLYVIDGTKIFTKNWLIGRLWSKYNPNPLEKKLQEVFEDLTLGFLSVTLIIFSAGKIVLSLFGILSEQVQPHLPIFLLILLKMGRGVNMNLLMEE